MVTLYRQNGLRQDGEIYLFFNPGSPGEKEDGERSGGWDGYLLGYVKISGMITKVGQES